jgi:hypothetical protein
LAIAPVPTPKRSGAKEQRNGIRNRNDRLISAHTDFLPKGKPGAQRAIALIAFFPHLVTKAAVH